ncbi:MAG: FHA domain-containing protein, partial [Actinomycetia bacterium]|nr:FHA domain-containing protein [Actinomycetes bacterium]
MDSTITFAGPIEVTEEEHIDFDGLSNEGPLLVVVKGIGVGQTFNIIEDVLVIGRDPKSDIFLDDITVSRKHAVINRENGDLRISDTGSLNGTYVNHERVDKV